jgi:hypothetical protein
MRENLREFIRREAGPDPANQLDLIRHLAPSILVAGGYDFDELRQLIQHGPSWRSSSGSEYVSATWPEVPVTDPLPCITIRPFTTDSYTTTPYELVAQLAWHLRDVLVGAESAPDFDGVIRLGYIEPENMSQWKEASERWQASRTVKPAPFLSHAPMLKQAGRRDLIAPVIEEAQRKCSDPSDAQAVFLALRSMAEAKAPPMYGVAPEGIQWTDANDEAQTLSLKNLKDRLRRSSKKKAGSPST